MNEVYPIYDFLFSLPSWPVPEIRRLIRLPSWPVPEIRRLIRLSPARYADRLIHNSSALSKCKVSSTAKINK
jgi:hypothetical protein